MMEKLRIGFIGLGGIATRSHIPALSKISEVAVTSGAEVDMYQANRTQQRFGIPKIYPDYQEMLKQEPLDAVYVCLPNSLHFQATSAALRQGLHVYCEKPMGLSSIEAEKLAGEADQQNLVLMPGYHLRYHPNFIRARKLLEEKRLGKILQIQASAVYSGPYRGWDPKSDWHLNPKSGGPLYDWGSHIFDLLYFITDLNIDFISATSQKTLPGFPIEDSIVAIFHAQGDIAGTINLSWGTRGNLLMLQIHGSAGSLLVSDDYFEHRTPMGGGLNKLRVLVENATDTLVQKVRPLVIRNQKDNLYFKSAQSFIAAIQGRENHRKNKWDAVNVLAALSAMATSIETGIPAYLNERTLTGILENE